MVFQREIIINFADGSSLEYSSGKRYCDGYELCSKIKEHIRQETGKSNFDLLDEQGEKLNNYEVITAIVLVCIFKPDKCEECGIDTKKLCGDGICRGCWNNKHTQENDGRPTIKKTFRIYNGTGLYDKDDIVAYKVYFYDDGTQDYLKIQYEEGRDKIVRDDVLMYDGNRLVLRNDIPDEFLEYYDELMVDTEIEIE
jgi:hypothetical protein